MKKKKKKLLYSIYQASTSIVPASPTSVSGYSEPPPTPDFCIEATRNGKPVMTGGVTRLRSDQVADEDACRQDCSER